MLITNSGCKKNDQVVNRTTDALIVGFVSEKCNFCWGWVINFENITIKAEEIRGLHFNSEETIFPISGKISIGTKTRCCSNNSMEMNSYDYYEILELIPD